MSSSILIVDDDPENRSILRARLEQAGYRVLEAMDGEEGIRRAQRERPQLIFLDVMMPRLDGWKTCQLLKSSDQTRNIPVIMLTACTQDIEQLRGWESGANDYLPKPWNPERLLETIKKHLSLKHDEICPQ